METFDIPSFVLDMGLNVDVPRQYRLKYGGYEEYKSSFFDEVNGELRVKAQYLDLLTRVPFEKTGITFALSNDASVAARRYHESYICQTPLCYAYEDLLALFLGKIPMVRQRNASRTFLQPLLPEACAKYLILTSLLEANAVKGRKAISLHLKRESLRVSYTYDPEEGDPEALSVRKAYFEAFGINLESIRSDFDTYAKNHRTKIRHSYFNGMKTLEILFNVRANASKKYSIASDLAKPLPKAECDIYEFLKERGGASLGLITEEFGYNSPRAAKYHVDKLISLNLVQMVGVSRSHGCFYRAL